MPLLTLQWPPGTQDTLPAPLWPRTHRPEGALLVTRSGGIYLQDEYLALSMLTLLPAARTTWGEWLCPSGYPFLPHPPPRLVNTEHHTRARYYLNKQGGKSAARPTPLLTPPDLLAAQPLFQLSPRKARGCAYQSCRLPHWGKTPQSLHVAGHTSRSCPAVTSTGRGCSGGPERRQQRKPQREAKAFQKGSNRNETPGGRSRRWPLESLQHLKSLP